jgi:hypothetical protein
VFANGRTSPSRCILGSVFAGLVVVGMGWPAPQAGAQGFFDSLFGGSDRYSRRAYAPSYDERFSSPDFSNRVARRERSSEGGGGGTYCVRLCDGRYFPLPRATNGAQLNSAKVCNALCPVAQTQVFNGHPDNGAAADGTRDRVVPDCSCTGRGPGGLAQIDVESDPTLRAGDVVATRAGLTVFKGGSQFPYKTADFTPIGSYSKVNSDLRQQLSDLRVDPSATPATPVQKLATSEENSKTSKPRPRKRVQATRSGDTWSWSLFR